MLKLLPILKTFFGISALCVTLSGCDKVEDANSQILPNPQFGLVPSTTSGKVPQALIGKWAMPKATVPMDSADKKFEYSVVLEFIENAGQVRMNVASSCSFSDGKVITPPTVPAAIFEFGEKANYKYFVVYNAVESHGGDEQHPCTAAAPGGVTWYSLESNNSTLKVTSGEQGNSGSNPVVFKKL